ncbi:PIN domain-containing protein [Aquiflexum sp. TKW24L]|nr:PIN domain-containing protein [Aquiflexum sp. TKW24L]
MSDTEFWEGYEIVLKNITILDHSIVPREKYHQSFEICKNIDPADTPFVAFSLFLNCKIWTGDKMLIKGLNKKNFKDFITTEDLFKDFLSKK